MILCLVFFAQIAMAQRFLHEFGKYSNEEFELQRYEKDPSAEAVVIYDIGESYFRESSDGLELNFERRMKIKIFNKAGLKWAEISIPYYREKNDWEKVHSIEGNTYNFENGKLQITPLDPKNSFEEIYNENWSLKKIAMPNVKEGSIIEIAYKIRSPYLFNLRNWEFQNKIPVIYSEYTTKMNPFYDYIYILEGAEKFDGYRTYDDQISRQFSGLKYQDKVFEFIMKDVPAFKDENFITSVNDYIIRLDFQLAAVHFPIGTTKAIMTTWPDLSKKMLGNESFGKFLNSSIKSGKEITDTMLVDSKSEGQKARIIDQFVKSNFNWNGYNDKFTSKSVKNFLISKTGNSADINLFLAGMLNAAGIKADPVILSTRGHGKIKLDYPFLSYFNYVVVLAKIDNIMVLLDATEPLCKFSVIPTRCLNEEGLVIQKDKIDWVNIKNASVSSIEYFYNIRPDVLKDSIFESSRLITTGYRAVDQRNEFSTSYKVLKDRLLGNNSLPGDTLIPKNLYQIDKSFELNYTKEYEMERIENKIIISPFCNNIVTENPLKQSIRSSPIDFIYRTANKFQSVIVVPGGYKLLTKPENIVVDNEKVKIVFNTDCLIRDTIKVSGLYEFKKDVYEISEYSDLRSYFNTIVDKFNEKLVFVKEL